jgi:hypothetical protein
MRSLNDAHETRIMGPVMTVKDATSVLKGLAQRRLEASCLMLVS